MRQTLRTKKETGITLIALVITIIILLILAAVTIAALSGDNGILKNAGNAKIESRAATVEERVKVWQAEEMINQYTNQNEKTFEELLEELREEELITQEEKEIFKEKGHLVIGSKDITTSEGIKKPEYTITNSLDEVKFSKTIEEADIAAEKPRFENYKIEGISSSKEGEYKSTGSIEGKSGNLEIIGDISDATFKYNLTDFMQGDEIFYCKINIDNEDYYQEIKVNQGEVITYEEDFEKIIYDGQPWTDDINDKYTNGKAKKTDTTNGASRVRFTYTGKGFEFITRIGETGYLRIRENERARILSSNAERG